MDINNNSNQTYLTNPLEIIQQLFEQYIATNGDVHQDWGISKHFESLLGSNWEQIPSLNTTLPETLPNGSLVRYRGMIQDMFDPEFFLGIYQEVHVHTNAKRTVTGKYRDIIQEKPDVLFDASDSRTSIPLERQPLYCVPIPGETAWCSIKKQSPSTKSNSSRSKRKEPEEETQEMSVENSVNKKTEPSPKEISQKTALPKDTESLSCIVKVYDSHIDGIFKLNETVEFVGILSHIAHNPSDEEEEELQTHYPPSSLTPRLHCLIFKKLSNPQLFLKTEEIPAAINTLRSDLVNLRAGIVDYLTSAFCGDALVAEYVLLNMLSHVYRRASEIMPLGKFALNVYNCPEDSSVFRKAVQNVYGFLCTKVCFLPLTLDNLNKVEFVPKKDYNLNRLNTGILQVSEGTNLVIDETALVDGQLDGNGTKHLKALNEVMLWQKLDYDFEYHPVTFHVDIPTLVISAGKSLFAGVDCQIPLKPTMEPAVPVVPSLDQFFEKARAYIAIFRTLEYHLEEEISKKIQLDFVEMRKKDPRIKQESFHLWLTLSRLIALSFGLETLNNDIWSRMLNMEDQRMSRIV